MFAGYGVTPLGVRVASHTPLLRSAVEVFREALNESGPRPMTPVLAGIDGTPVLDRARALDILSEQLAAPVQWADCMRGLREFGASVSVELPSGADLSRLVGDSEPTIAARALGEFGSVEGLAA